MAPVRTHRHDWMSCGDGHNTSGPASLSFGLSVVILALLLIVALMFLGGFF